MVKRVNANLPDEIHKALRVKLAEDGANFSDWLRRKITEYVEPKGKRRKGKEA
jgi:plasmid stability protein